MKNKSLGVLPLRLTTCVCCPAFFGAGYGSQDIRAGDNANGSVLLVNHDDTMDMGVCHQTSQVADRGIRGDGHRVGCHIPAYFVRGEVVDIHELPSRVGATMVRAAPLGSVPLFLAQETKSVLEITPTHRPSALMTRAPLIENWDNM